MPTRKHPLGPVVLDDCEVSAEDGAELVLLLTAMQMWPGHIRCEAIFGTPKGALPRKWGFTLRPGEVALGVHRLNHGSRLGDQPVVLGFAAKRDWFPTRILGEEAKERVVDALADLLIQKTGAKR